jgi:transcriptional regulator with XRE-family HTH domain
MQLGRIVRKLREARDITQVELAKAVGVTQAYIAKLESGAKVNPSLSVLTGLALALDVQVADLLHAKTRRRKA